MPNILTYKEKKPSIHKTAFIWPTAQIIGDVEIKERVGVWSGAVIRGDEEKVVIGAYSSILENCIVKLRRIAQSKLKIT